MFLHGLKVLRDLEGRTSALCAAGVLGLAALFMLQGCAGGSPTASAEGAGAVPTRSAGAVEAPADQKSFEADYRIGPNDLLEINVLGVEDLARTVRVNSSGGISLPLVGVIHVAGLTARETEALLATKYQEDYLQDPQISVFISEFTSQRFTVDGAVSRPGVYPLAGKMTLLRALATAGGKGELADLENVMLFRTGADGETDQKKFNVLKIRNGEQPDPVLQRDDLVVVNQNPSRVTFRDSLFKDILDTLNPFSSTYYNVDSGAR